MAESVVELAWTDLITAFSQIDGTSHLTDGGGAFRSTVQHVYKRLFMMNDYPSDCPSISVWLKAWEPVYDDTDNQVSHINAEFWVGGYLNSNNDENVTNRQTQSSLDAIALQHDMFRVISDLSRSHLNSTTRFIVEKPGKFVNVPPFKDNIAEFGTKLNVMILWGSVNLLSNAGT